MNEKQTESIDFEPTSAREMVIKTVIELADIDGGDEPDVVKMGIVRLGPNDILMARIKQPTAIQAGERTSLIQIHNFKLTVYHLSEPRLTKSGAMAHFESVTVSELVDEPVVSDNGTEDYYDMIESDADETIRDFFVSNNINRSTINPPNKP